MLSEMVSCYVCLQTPMLTNSPIIIWKLSFLVLWSELLISWSLAESFWEILVSEKENSVRIQRSNLQTGSSPVWLLNFSEPWLQSVRALVKPDICYDLFNNLCILDFLWAVELTIYRTGESGYGRTAHLPGLGERWLGSWPSLQHHGTTALWPRGGLTSGTSCTIPWHVLGVPGGLGWDGRGISSLGPCFIPLGIPIRLCLYPPQPLPAGATISRHVPFCSQFWPRQEMDVEPQSATVGRRGLEFGLVFSISNNRALVKPQRRRCYHCSKLIVSRVPQMWDPKA